MNLTPRFASRPRAFAALGTAAFALALAGCNSGTPTDTAQAPAASNATTTCFSPS